MDTSNWIAIVSAAIAFASAASANHEKKEARKARAAAQKAAEESVRAQKKAAKALKQIAARKPWEVTKDARGQYRLTCQVDRAFGIRTKVKGAIEADTELIPETMKLGESAIFNAEEGEGVFAIKLTWHRRPDFSDLRQSFSSAMPH